MQWATCQHSYNKEVNQELVDSLAWSVQPRDKQDTLPQTAGGEDGS